MHGHTVLYNKIIDINSEVQQLIIDQNNNTLVKEENYKKLLSKWFEL